MKKVITSSISILTIAMVSISAAQAQHRYSDEDRAYEHSHKRHIVKEIHHERDRHHRWKHRNRIVEKHIIRDFGNRRVEKFIYRRHGYKHVDKYVYRYAPRRHYHRRWSEYSSYYRPTYRAEPRVVIRTHNPALPVIAGGIIGGVLSDGDPAAVLGGALFGAALDDISHH